MHYSCNYCNRPYQADDIITDVCEGCRLKSEQQKKIDKQINDLRSYWYDSDSSQCTSNSF